MVVYINKNQLLVAKSIYDKLDRQIRCPDCVISSRFNIPKVLIELGIPIKEKDGSDRSLIDIYDDLGRKIEFIEHYQNQK